MVEAFTSKSVNVVCAIAILAFRAITFVARRVSRKRFAHAITVHTISFFVANRALTHAVVLIVDALASFVDTHWSLTITRTRTGFTRHALRDAHTRNALTSVSAGVSVGDIDACRSVTHLAFVVITVLVARGLVLHTTTGGNALWDLRSAFGVVFELAITHTCVVRHTETNFASFFAPGITLDFVIA